MKEDGILRVGIIGTGWIAEKADGVLCNLQSSASCVGDNIGVIAGT